MGPRQAVAALSFFAFGITVGSAQTLSSSKLSAHLINAYTAGSSNIVAGHPRLLKVLGLDSGFPSGMVQAMRDYKAKVPSGKLVVRIYSPKTCSLTDDATASASDCARFPAIAAPLVPVSFALPRLTCF
jgi:hypothetical protein